MIAKRRRRALFFVGLLVGALVGYLVWHWRPIESYEIPQLDPEPTLDTATENRVVAFCSACHSMPDPKSFPRDAWYHQVLQGYHAYARSGRTDLDPPPAYLAVAYFRSRAQSN